jgi:rRNA maturation endonuclease Nob1
MGAPNVLDTAALINWPIELLDRGYVVENQRLEVSRVSPERICLETGDLDGLSETDLLLLALVIDIKGHLYTDDYRIQNVCSSAGIKWSPVETVGISETWSWELKCGGCGRVTSGRGRTRFARESPGECEDCGSELRFSKI